MDPYRGERISKLPQNVAWADLVAEVQAHEDDYWEKQAAKVRKRALTDEQLAQQDERRAFYRGMRAVLDFPDKGRKAIEDALARGKGA